MNEKRTKEKKNINKIYIPLQQMNWKGVEKPWQKNKVWFDESMGGMAFGNIFFSIFEMDSAQREIWVQE